MGIDIITYTCDFCFESTVAPRYSARASTGTCPYCWSQAFDLGAPTPVQRYVNNWLDFHEYIDGLSR